MSTTMFDPDKVIADVEVFQGKFNKVEVSQDPPAVGHRCNLVIDPTKPFMVNLEWQIDGQLGEVNTQLNDIESKAWHIQVYAEKMGPGEDKKIFDKVWTNAINTVTSLPVIYPYTCEIPANSLEQHLPGSGMYRLCTVVWANTEVPGCHDIIGCHEGPMVLAEEPH